MACMFCGSHDNLTDEHVFPAFMGGTIVVLDGSCNKCNAAFGTYEATIKKNTVVLLNLLQIENRDGNVPNAKVNADIRGVDLKGLNAFRDGSGEIRLSDVVVPAIDEHGNAHRKGFFVTKESGDKFIERARARGDNVTELGITEEIVFDAYYTLALPFTFSFESRKVAAKIALAAIAYKCGLQFASLPEFDKLRQVDEVQTAQDLPVRIFANELFMAAHARTAHQHSVMCYMSAGMRKAWALVTLFGGPSYLVEVTPDYNQKESRQFSVFYDAASKAQLNPVVLADEMTDRLCALSENEI